VRLPWGDRGLFETKYRFGDRTQFYTGGVFAEAFVLICGMILPIVG
jgi:hypothetical protein